MHQKEARVFYFFLGERGPRRIAPPAGSQRLGSNDLLPRYGRNVAHDCDFAHA